MQVMERERSLADHLHEAGREPRDVAALRAANSAGRAAAPETVAAWIEEAFPRV